MRSISGDSPAKPEEILLVGLDDDQWPAAGTTGYRCESGDGSRRLEASFAESARPSERSHAIMKG